MYILINGRRLDNLRRDYGHTQKELAAMAGCTKYTMSRWCADGEHRVRKSSIDDLAEALGLPADRLIESIEAGEHNGDAPERSCRATDLTAAEAEWLRVYRSLPPLEQAKLRVRMEEIIQEIASGA